MRHPSPLPPGSYGRAFRVRDGAALGLTPGRLRGSDLQRPFHGVRSVGLDLEEVAERCRALLPALTPAHAISHATGALLLGGPLPLRLRDASRPIDVATLGGPRMQRAGVRGHELPADTPVTRSALGIPVVAPADTWCHLAAETAHKTRERRILLSHEDLVAVGDAFVSGTRRAHGTRTSPLCTLDDLRDALERHGRRRGARALAAALPCVRCGVDSARETLLRLTIVDAGLAEPEIGIEVRTPEGTFFLDLGYADAKVAIEYEGDHHRTDMTQWRRDFVRVRALQAAGWLVIRVNADDLASPRARAALVAQIRQHLRARRA